MSIIKVDAIGDKCPVPIIKTKKALKKISDGDIIEVHVDNLTAARNVEDMAANLGIIAKNEKLGETHFVIAIDTAAAKSKEKEVPGKAPIASLPENTVVAVDTDKMGRGDDELGAVLMKGFIYAVSQLETLPKTILFYNGGAKIPVEGSVCLEDLKNMEAQGVEILTCGTCLNFFNLTDNLAVGKIANMYLIVETLNNATKVIKP